MRKFHATMTAVWLAVVPISLITGWVESIIFVSACSIYANAIAHWSAFQAKKAEDS